MNDITNVNNAKTDISLKEVISNKKFIIPLYQRNYKWNKNTAVKLAKDLTYEYKNNKNKKTIGLITLYNKNEGSDYYIIDGQQRFITLSIIFSLLGEKNIIDLSFERDENPNTGARISAIKNCDNTGNSGTTDIDRICRNADEIREKVLKNFDEKEDFAKYILENCYMLQSVMTEEPVQEFMNLNAYKTKFSMSDYVRANLIILNTFSKDALEGRIREVSKSLTEHTYKSAVSNLCNEILDILYYEEKGKAGKFDSIYNLLISGDHVIDADKTKESRLNILYYKSGIEDYRCEYDAGDSDKQIDTLLKLAFILRMLKQLKSDMDDGDYSSAKAIDNYQKIKNKAFFSIVDELNTKDLDISLSTLLERCSNVSELVINSIGSDKNDLILANRLFEAYMSSGIMQETDNSAERNENEFDLKYMTDDDIISIISESGKYMLNRYISERNIVNNATIKAPPILDLTDTENDDNTGVSDNIGDTITVGDLFDEYYVKIPVVQRDYCMGAQFNYESASEDFLSYIIDGFKQNKSLTASTILISVNDENKTIYIFDGQQRTYTLFNILKHLQNKKYPDDKYIFIGRGERKNGSKYSEYSVNNLNEQLKKRLENIDNNKFNDYIRTKVSFIVKQIGNPSSAEQFFMDINGGVALKPYEIYKSCLSARLQEVYDDKGRAFMLKLENKWLNSIYKLMIIVGSDETDMEELIEIRLIEYLCRYRYQAYHKPECVQCFDAIDTKSEIVANTNKYLSELNEEDFEEIAKILDYYFPDDYSRSDIQNLSKADCQDYFTDSSKNEEHLCLLDLILEKPEPSNVFYRFTESLSQTNREKLCSFYSCDTKYLIENIYDKDELIKKAIENKGEEIETGKISYYNGIITRIKLHFFGGYNNSFEDVIIKYENEMPAYYSDIITNTDYDVKYLQNTTSAYYLYKKVAENEKVRNWIGIDNNGESSFFYTDPKKLPNDNKIRFPNGNLCKFALSKYKDAGISPSEFDYIRFMDRTDAYAIKNRNNIENLAYKYN